MQSSKFLLRGAAFAAVLAMASIPALAASSGGSSGGGSTPKPTVSAKKLKCKKGYIVKVKTENGKKVKYCARAVYGELPDKDLLEQAITLAKEGEYDWALQVLALVKDKNDPMALNYMGYSHRKAGRLVTGISYYRKALAINPDFVLAREYLGEGYVTVGRVDLAQVELAEIGKRCGVNCSEYKDLAKAIAAGVN